MNENEDTPLEEAAPPKKKRSKKKRSKKKASSKRDAAKKKRPKKKASKKGGKKKASKKKAKKEKRELATWVRCFNKTFSAPDEGRIPTPEYAEKRMKLSVAGEHYKVLAAFAKEKGITTREAVDKALFSGFSRLRTLNKFSTK